MTGPKQVTGQQTGVEFPSNLDPLSNAGPAFLTEAFRATGALPPDNAVTEITRFEEFIGGGAGRKAKLSVTYDRPDDALHNDLFVKYPRDFGDPLRDLFAHLMEPETRFALLSRNPAFPIRVPACYFADYDPDNKTGLLITEDIRYGEDGNEPFFDKCLDYEITDPLEHYQALIRAVARLAAAHKAGLFGDEIDRQFPYDPTVIRQDDRIPYSAEQLQEKTGLIIQFAKDYPQLLPDNLQDIAFLEQFAADTGEFLKNEIKIKEYLNSQPDRIALCHWNANIDNAWFWRDEQRVMQAGLLDWGSVSQMNVAQSIFGVLCACETDFWDRHKDDLVKLFCEEFTGHGGAALDPEELNFQVDLYAALLGIAWMTDAPSIIKAQVSDLNHVRDRYDPAIRDDFLARAQLQLMVVFLNAWQKGNYGRLIKKFQTFWA